MNNSSPPIIIPRQTVNNLKIHIKVSRVESECVQLETPELNLGKLQADDISNYKHGHVRCVMLLPVCRFSSPTAESDPRYIMNRVAQAYPVVPGTNNIHLLTVVLC